jgi:hypothetical protein
MAAEWLIAVMLAAPAQRAVDYLVREVPRWSKENHCFSCHNNGDGARALYAAAHRRYRVPPAALADTTRWLLHPADWDNNRGNPFFSDKKLARIQFAASLTEAYQTGAVRDATALTDAAKSLLSYQESDGSWRIDSGAAAGSPATYGTALATYMARRTLEATGNAEFASAMARANQWLRQAKPASIPDAAAILMAAGKKECLDLILRAQNSDGGWGPHRHAPSEAFDTAIVLLALP